MGLRPSVAGSNALGLADGIPDIFGGGASTPVARRSSESRCAEPRPRGSGFWRRRHILLTGFNNFMLCFEPNLSDPEELFSAATAGT